MTYVTKQNHGSLLAGCRLAALKAEAELLSIETPQPQPPSSSDEEISSTSDESSDSPQPSSEPAVEGADSDAMSLCSDASIASSVAVPPYPDMGDLRDLVSIRHAHL